MLRLYLASIPNDYPTGGRIPIITDHSLPAKSHADAATLLTLSSPRYSRVAALVGLSCLRWRQTATLRVLEYS